MLTASVHYSGNNPSGYGAKDYVETQIGCVKVGFFGLTTWAFDDQDQPLTGDYYPDMPTDLNFTAVAQAQVAAHRSSVDLLVALTHIGVQEDTVLALSQAGIDVILGGHSHTLIQSIPAFAPERLPSFRRAHSLRTSIASTSPGTSSRRRS